MFGSRYMPCPVCGASLDRDERESHECGRERRIEYQFFQLRQAVEHVEADIAAYLNSPRGRFEVWYAARERTRRQ